MTVSRVQETGYPESALRQQLRREMKLGEEMAGDPANANLPDLAPRITTIYSPWYGRTCRVCKDKFREADRVRLCPICQTPYHDDEQYGLHCWQEHFAALQDPHAPGSAAKRVGPCCDYRWDGRLPDAPARNLPPGEESPRIAPSESLVTQFVAGMERIWRPFGEQKVEKVQRGAAIVGRECPWCRFRVRAGDWVVACPCGCGAYFHQDVFRHLTCWNEWNGVEGNDYCPITGRSYSPEHDDHDG